jgi:hypothetical protein
MMRNDRQFRQGLPLKPGGLVSVRIPAKRSMQCRRIVDVSLEVHRLGWPVQIACDQEPGNFTRDNEDN